VKKDTYSYIWLNVQKVSKKEALDYTEKYAILILYFVSGVISFWLTIAIFTGKSKAPAFIVFLTYQSFLYIGWQDLYLEGPTQYLFMFFRIFKLEHPKFDNPFVSNEIVDLG
jgi:hypothetical protein